MIDFLTPRRTNLVVFMGCLCLMLVAMIFQHLMQLEPCPLCITQRVIVIIIGLIALAAWLQNPNVLGRRIYATLSIAVSALGIVVASRHVWLQNLPEDEAPACGPGLAYIIDALPIQDVITLLFKGDGNCAEVAWSLFGLSIPVWTLVAFLGLTGLAIWQLIRKN